MIFQFFSRQIEFSSTFQESPLNPSTFQACANPVFPVGGVQLIKMTGALAKLDFSVYSPWLLMYKNWFLELLKKEAQ